MGFHHYVAEEDAVMHDSPNVYDHGANFGTNYADNAYIMTMIQDIQLKQDERYDEECKWRESFEAAQMEQFRLMQHHMSTQDSNFETFASYMTEALVSLHTDVNENHEAILARINHIIYVHDDDSHRYGSLYREICDVIDSQYHNDGHGWQRGAPKGRGRR